MKWEKACTWTIAELKVNSFLLNEWTRLIIRTPELVYLGINIDQLASIIPDDLPQDVKFDVWVPTQPPTPTNITTA